MNKYLILAAGNEDIKAGLIQAKDGVLDIVKFIINMIVVPLGSVALIGILIFLILKIAKMTRQHDDFNKTLVEIIIAIITIVLVSSAPFWMWTMIGQGGTGGGSSTITAQLVGVSDEFLI